MPIESFTGTLENAKALRVYTLRLVYEYCCHLQRDKSISSGLASLCIIIRQQPVVNDTDFGYKEELKTSILKKIHFVYLEKIQDLFAFLYEHIKYIQENVNKQQSQNIFMKSEATTKTGPLFGMILIENIESYFGNVVDYENMGPKLFLFIKLMKKLDKLMPFNSNLCFTYNYNKKVCKYEDFLAFIKSEGLNCYRVSSTKIQKNGFDYESEYSREFFRLYEIQENQEE